MFLFPIRSSPASSAFEMFEVNDLLFQNINTKLAYKDEDTYLSGPEPDLKEVVKGTWLRSDRCRTETCKKIFITVTVTVIVVVTLSTTGTLNPPPHICYIKKGQPP